MSIITILFYSFVVAVALQIGFYSFFLLAFSLKKPKNSISKNIPVSVIICAKNEAESLQEYLPFFLEQNYSNFELILVNDGSSDNTLEVMESFEANHNNIKIVNVKTIEKFWGNKKYALTLGIKAASHDFLLFTDADCKPNSDYWISEMSSQFSNTKSIVLGYGAYEHIRGSFLNTLIRFETLLTAIQYFSYANSGIPYMGVGRNLAYRKELFFNNSGFMGHMDVKSGDDDLFVNAAATSKNTTISYSPKSFTLSKPKMSFKDWFIQKRRHISTSKYYKPKHKFLLGLFYFSQLTFFILAILLLSLQYQWMLVLILVSLRFLLCFTVFGISSKKLKTPYLIIFTPIIELFLITFQIVIFSANLISKQNRWK